MSVTLVHPVMAAGRNDMPLGRGTRVVPSNIVLDRGLSSPRKGKILGSELPVRNDVAYPQITSAYNCYRYY